MCFFADLFQVIFLLYMRRGINDFHDGCVVHHSLERDGDRTILKNMYRSSKCSFIAQGKYGLLGADDVL